MTNYVLDLRKPIEIPAAVYETVARSRESMSEINVILLHNEPANIIRGRGEKFIHQNSDVIEVRRPDGGHSWYHPGTFCWMRARPYGGIGGPVEQEAWSSTVRNTIEQLMGVDLSSTKYCGSDLYADNSLQKQLLGLSARETGTPRIRLERCCWYEQDPVSGIEHLLKADGIKPEDFRNAIELVPDGFYSALTEHYDGQRLSAADFVGEDSLRFAESLQNVDGGSNNPVSCVMGRRYNYQR